MLPDAGRIINNKPHYLTKESTVAVVAVESAPRREEKLFLFVFSSTIGHTKEPL